MGANDPRGMASLGSRGLIGRIYVGDLVTFLHTKSVSSRPHSYGEEGFKGTLATELYINICPLGVWPVWTQGFNWQDLCRGQLSIATW